MLLSFVRFHTNLTYQYMLLVLGPFDRPVHLFSFLHDLHSRLRKACELSTQSTV